MNFKEKLRHISAFVFDIDGVLTNGKIFLNADNTTSRAVNAKDGYAIQRAVKEGYTVAIITYAKDPILKERFQALGVSAFYPGSIDKEDDLKDFSTVYNIPEDQILYMGDDLPDYLAMKRCGVATCPDDAAQEIRALCDYISPLKGGEGCVRDVIEQVLRLHGKWNLFE